jgi:hypothetical protein
MEEILDLKYSDWYNLASQKFALKISDIINLKHGEQLEVLILDRNVWDITLNPQTNIPNVNHDPETFFRYNRGTYVHNKDLSGELTMHWKDKDSTDKFEFHLEYMPGKWYPLNNGVMPGEEQGLPWTEEQHWTKFPQTTKVGYRGPMILWSKLKEMPKIYWKEFEERYFKWIFSDVDKPKGIWSGNTSEMAARLCFNKIFIRLRENNKEKPDKIIICLQETTRGSNRKMYGYSMVKQIYNPSEGFIFTDNMKSLFTYNLIPISNFNMKNVDNNYVMEYE